MKQIKINAEYDCFPLWYKNDLGMYENISPQALNLSEKLVKRIYDWGQQFDSTLNADYPPESGFSDSIKEKKFEDDGVKIWRKLINEIGDVYQVSYRSIIYNKLFDDINEYY